MGIKETHEGEQEEGLPLLWPSLGWEMERMVTTKVLWT